jgi:hypothetical protein
MISLTIIQHPAGQIEGFESGILFYSFFLYCENIPVLSGRNYPGTDRSGRFDYGSFKSN